jgi:uncharacterized membrane protein
MNFLFDPVWPWSRLWDLLLQVPLAIRVLAALAAAACLPLPVLIPSRIRGLFLAMLGVAGLSLGFVIRHLWPLAWSDAHHVTGSGFAAFFVTLGWLLLLVLLLVGPFLLAGLSVVGYAGSARVPRTRRGLIIGLRLFAFLLAVVAVWRPALARIVSEQPHTLLYIVVDRSKSMTIADERSGRSRWDQMQRSIADSEPALARLLDDHQVEVRWFAFDQDLAEFDPANPGSPEGKRTDFGTMLRQLYDRRDTQVPLRGLLVVSDGADNGINIPALAEAARWRGVPCTIHTFACGSPRTSSRENDVAITSISTSPTPFVPVKGRLRVKLSIDARGFENTKARVRLFLEGDDGMDREVTARDVVLPLTTGNEVVLECDAPAQPGEVKVKAVVEPAEPDKFPFNNTIETFVTVSKEGISVLLVDRQRAFEPAFICDALAEDPRIRVTAVWLRGGKPLPGTEAARLFSGKEQPYDVIILGEVTIDQLNGIDPQAVKRIVELVNRGAGLMVLGGLTNLGNGGWEGSPLEPLLPVDLSLREQEERQVGMYPTSDGARLAPYILRLDNDPELKMGWKELNEIAKLDGYTRLRAKKQANVTVLATTQEEEKGDPLLVMQTYSAGAAKGRGNVARVLVFGGDTTYRWKRSERGAPLFDRFWKQVVVWLARQEDASGSVWVKPDVRRLPARNELGFQVGLRGKGGGPDVRDGKYEVTIQTPTGQKIRTPVVLGATENRGTFTATQTPGVYRITVKGEGKDPSGGVVSGESSARVIVYDEDLEMTRRAADPEFLTRLAVAGGGGESLRVEQFADFLNRLTEQPLDRGRLKQTLRPDWQTRGRSPFLVIYFVVFCVVVCAEWALRRWWGLV